MRGCCCRIRSRGRAARGPGAGLEPLQRPVRRRQRAPLLDEVLGGGEGSAIAVGWRGHRPLQLVQPALDALPVEVRRRECPGAAPGRGGWPLPPALGVRGSPPAPGAVHGAASSSAGAPARSLAAEPDPEEDHHQAADPSAGVSRGGPRGGRRGRGGSRLRRGCWGRRGRSARGSLNRSSSRAGGCEGPPAPPAARVRGGGLRAVRPPRRWGRGSRIWSTSSSASVDVAAEGGVLGFEEDVLDPAVDFVLALASPSIRWLASSWPGRGGRCGTRRRSRPGSRRGRRRPAPARGAADSLGCRRARGRPAATGQRFGPPTSRPRRSRRGPTCRRPARRRCTRAFGAEGELPEGLGRPRAAVRRSPTPPSPRSVDRRRTEKVLAELGTSEHAAARERLRPQDGGLCGPGLGGAGRTDAGGGAGGTDSAASSSGPRESRSSSMGSNETPKSSTGGGAESGGAVGAMPLAALDLLQGGADAAVVGVQRLRHHDEVGRLLRVTVIERFAGLSQELTDLGLDLERVLHLDEQLARILVAGELQQDPLDLLFRVEEVALIEVVDGLDQQLVDHIGGRGVELADDLGQIDLGRAGGQLSLEVDRGSERRGRAGARTRDRSKPLRAGCPGAS